MQPRRRLVPQRPPEANLHGALIEQVFAAHHLRDAIRQVVGHHREVIGVESVAAAEDRVAHRPEIGDMASAGAIDELERLVGEPKPDGAFRQPAIAAGPGIDTTPPPEWPRACSRSSR